MAPEPLERLFQAVVHTIRRLETPVEAVRIDRDRNLVLVEGVTASWGPRQLLFHALDQAGLAFEAYTSRGGTSGIRISADGATERDLL